VVQSSKEAGRKVVGFILDEYIISIFVWFGQQDFDNSYLFSIA